MNLYINLIISFLNIVVKISKTSKFKELIFSNESFKLFISLKGPIDTLYFIFDNLIIFKLLIQV